MVGFATHLGHDPYISINLTQPPQRPKVSRKPIVLLVSLCLILSAVLIPVASRLPRLIEAELVLGVWWLIWVIALSALLFRGHKVEDDADWIGNGGERTKSWLEWLNIPADSGCLLDEGCFMIFVAIIAFLLLGLAFLVLIEFVVPAIALLLFASIGGMFARAVNDNHHCEGRLGLSLLWGAIWATVYVGPIAAIVIWVISLLPRPS